jgi:hypothetical protein
MPLRENFPERPFFVRGFLLQEGTEQAVLIIFDKIYFEYCRNSDQRVEIANLG